MLMKLTPGQAFCESSYEGHLMVPNSKDEATFIGNYLTGLMVKFSFFFCSSSYFAVST